MELPGDRAAKEAIGYLRSAHRRKVGLFRPITLWPFPEKELAALIREVDRIFVAEMNTDKVLTR